MPVAPSPTPAAPSTPATPPAATPPPEDAMDATFKLLYDAAESEEPKPEPEKRGKTLMQAIEEPAPEAAEPTAEEKAAAEKKKKDEEAAAAAAANTPPEPAPVRVRKRREAEPTPATPPTPTPEPKAETPPAPSEDEQFEAGLLEEERDQLNLARFAERKDPAKYKGQVARVTKFLKEHQAYLEKNPEATQPGTDAEEKYKQWLAKNNTSLPPREMKILEREQIAEETTAKLSKETDAKLAEIYDDQFRRTEEPKIKAKADELFVQLTKDAVPPELAKLAQEKGIEEARKEYPLEYRVSGEILTEIASDAEVLEKLVTSNPKTGKKLLDYDPYNPQHARILQFVREQGEAFKNGPLPHQPPETPLARSNRLKLQQRDGKSFLTRDEYFALAEKQRAPYWTFSTDQLVKISALRAKDRIAAKVKAERERLEAEGWVRKPAAAPVKAAEPPPAPGSPPAPRPTPMPNGGPSAGEIPDRILSILHGE